jgi:hypothetical protein
VSQDLSFFARGRVEIDRSCGLLFRGRWSGFPGADGYSRTDRMVIDVS